MALADFTEPWNQAVPVRLQKSVEFAMPSRALITCGPSGKPNSSRISLVASGDGMSSRKSKILEYSSNFVQDVQLVAIDG